LGFKVLPEVPGFAARFSDRFAYTIDAHYIVWIKRFAAIC
jgi:hypothetical protein